MQSLSISRIACILAFQSTCYSSDIKINACAAIMGIEYDNLHLYSSRYHIDSIFQYERRGVQENGQSYSVDGDTNKTRNTFKDGRLASAEVIRPYMFLNSPGTAKWRWEGDTAFLDTLEIANHRSGMLLKNGRITEKFLSPFGPNMKVRYGDNFTVREIMGRGTIMIDSIHFTESAAFGFTKVDGVTDTYPSTCFAKDSICECGNEKWAIEPDRINYYIQRRLSETWFTSGTPPIKDAKREKSKTRSPKPRPSNPCGDDDLQISSNHLKFGNEIRSIARNRKPFTVSAGIENDTIRFLLKGTDAKAMKSYILGMDVPMSTKDPEGINEIIDQSIFTETSLKKVSSIAHIRLGIEFEEVSSLESKAPENARTLIFNVVLALTNAAPAGMKLLSLGENDSVLYEIGHQRFEYKKKYDLCASDGVSQKISGDWLVTDFSNE